jgi:hypothetical protein
MLSPYPPVLQEVLQGVMVNPDPGRRNLERTDPRRTDAEPRGALAVGDYFRDRRLAVADKKPSSAAHLFQLFRQVGLEVGDSYGLHMTNYGHLGGSVNDRKTSEPAQEARGT